VTARKPAETPTAVPAASAETMPSPDGLPRRRKPVARATKPVDEDALADQIEAEVAAEEAAAELPNEPEIPETLLQRGARLSSLEVARMIVDAAEDKKAADIVLLDVSELTTMADYFVICSGTSRRQLHAISEEIDHTLEEGLGDHRLGIEGYNESRWILLDYGDVVIHLFEPETRQYYDLENLWGRATKVPFEPASAKTPEVL